MLPARRAGSHEPRPTRLDSPNFQSPGAGAAARIAAIESQFAELAAELEILRAEFQGAAKPA